MLTEKSTLEDLAVLLAQANGRTLKLSARGGLYVVALRYPGGTAQLANESLSGALNGAVTLVAMAGEAPALADDPTPDPTGTRVVAVVPPPPDEEPL